MKIRVRRRHIEAGARKEKRACPIALAMREVGINAHVGSYIVRDNLSIACYLPESAVDFIKKFDAGLPVRPFTFEVRL